MLFDEEQLVFHVKLETEAREQRVGKDSLTFGSEDKVSHGLVYTSLLIIIMLPTQGYDLCGFDLASILQGKDDGDTILELLSSGESVESIPELRTQLVRFVGRFIMDIARMSVRALRSSSGNETETRRMPEIS